MAALLHRYPPKGVSAMIDFLIGLAYVALVISPAILASLQVNRSHSGDL